MQAILTVALLLITLLLQGGLRLLSSFDLLLPLLVAIIVKRGQSEALIYSFGAGFYQDMLYGAGYINTLIKTAAAALASQLKKYIVLENDKLCSLLALMITPISIIASLYAVSIFHNAKQISFPWLNMLISTFLNAVLAPLFYWVLTRIDPNEQ